jgi:MFS family permease
MALNAIQGLYMPAVQAAVPSLAPTEKLVPANSVVTMVNMFSSIAGMAIAGMLYARFGLLPILIVAAICFAITAVMDLLIRIPYKKPDNTGSMTQIVKDDMSKAFKYVMKENPIISKVAFIAFYLQLTLIPMIIVGVPVLITQYLGFGMNYVGYSQSIMMVGGLIGGIITGALSTRLTMKGLPFRAFIASILFCLISLPFLFPTSEFTAFVIITATTTIAFAIIQTCNIPLFAFIQAKTPPELIGKVMSLFVILPFVASAIGAMLYGILYEQFYSIPWAVIIGTFFITIFIIIYAFVQFKNVKEDVPAEEVDEESTAEVE